MADINGKCERIFLWRPWFPDGIYFEAMKRYAICRDLNDLLTNVESELAIYLGSKYVIIMPSGRTAIFSILKEIIPKDKTEILLPSLICKSVPHVIKAAGKIPIFLEIEPYMFNINDKSIEDQISERTGAIIVAHQFGFPSNMTNIIPLAKRKNILVIEDAAQALGSIYMGRKVGTLGDVGVLSFNNKVIDACGGGAVATDDEMLFKRIKSFRDSNFSIKRKGFLKCMFRCWLLSHYPRIAEAISKKLPSCDDLNIPNFIYVSTLILLKLLLPWIDFIKNERGKNFKLYDHYIISSFVEKPIQASNMQPSYTFYTLKLKTKHLMDQRTLILDSLSKFGIYARPIANATYKFFDSSIHLPVADMISQSIFQLPTDPNLSEEEIKNASMIINQVIDNFVRNVRGDNVSEEEKSGNYPVFH